jgi:hypothetical protein
MQLPITYKAGEEPGGSITISAAIATMRSASNGYGDHLCSGNAALTLECSLPRPCVTQFEIQTIINSTKYGIILHSSNF